MASKSFYDLTKDVALSAKSLFKYRIKRDNTIPSKGGQKDFEPDGTWMQSKALEAFIQERTAVLSEQRVEKLKNLVLGVWDAEKNLVNLDKPGKFWSHMGFTDKRRNWLYPEEALFLMEINALEVYQRGVPMSIQEAYDVFLSGDVSLTEYQVFSHLRRLGYVVLRHETQALVTDYERQINLDKYLDKRTLKARKKKGGHPQVGKVSVSSKTADEDGGQAAFTSQQDQPSAPGQSSVSSQRNDSPLDDMQEEMQSPQDCVSGDGTNGGLAVAGSADCVEQTGKAEACSSVEQQEEGLKRLRPQGESVESEEGDGARDAKRMCLNQGDDITSVSSEVKVTEHLLKHDQQPTSAGDQARMFYSELWLDCFLQRSQASKTTEGSEQKPCLRQTSWQDNFMKFPDLAGKQILSLVMPEKKLLPDNIHISEDTDEMLLFDVEDYRLKNPSEPVTRQAQQEEEREKRIGALNFSFAEWTQRKPVVEAHNWTEHKRKTAERLTELSNCTPVSHLWQGPITPLVNPLDAWNTESILGKLSVVKNADDQELKLSDDVVEQSHVSFDVHLPDSKFRKSMPGKPDHRVLVAKSRVSSPPQLSQLQALSQPDGVPVHWAVVDSGEIAFYEFDTRHQLETLT